MRNAYPSYVALSGGVGGAKLALGLSNAVSADELLVVANVGDDFEHLGLYICPDLDTLAYTISGLNNWQLGWGRKDETWNFMDTLADLGGEAWFRLGDRDLALHVRRSRLLRDGANLSSITKEIAFRLGVQCAICPCSDDPIRTMVTTDAGELEFQRYFVEQRAVPRIRSLRYQGAETARPSKPFVDALSGNRLQAVIICPSNPVLSIGPILAMRQARDALRHTAVPIVAVSPMRSGKAFKGPTESNMRDLGMTPDSLGVAQYYSSLIDGIIIDHSDADLAPHIRKLGISVTFADISMPAPEDCGRLAREVVGIVERNEIRKRVVE